jgi:bifunctional DNA-binding transcriptional regulator/antitoxin component of YhaV-PrlF toxin-antitoxin module
MTTAVAGKGQVTIPEPVRDRPGIMARSKVAFELAPNGRAVLTKIAKTEPIPDAGR